MKSILDQEIQTFIRLNLKTNVSDLLLQKNKWADYPMTEIAEQIQCLQKAEKKLPTWFVTENIIYTSLSLEQCSSELTAQFKSKVIKGKNLVDLSGGFGVDSYFFAKRFEKVMHIEPNLGLQNLVKHNFEQLKCDNIAFLNQTALAFLQLANQVDVIYLDPSRRDDAKQKVYGLEDCEPNVLDLLPILFEKTQTILLKTSPMLDIDLAIRQLNFVKRVFVVSVENEVKELLFLLENEIEFDTENIEIQAVDLKKNTPNKVFSLTKKEEKTSQISYSKPLKYLIEPNLGILKAGAFKSFAQKFDLLKLHPNSHLYTTDSQMNLTEIPARVFRIEAICKYDKKTVQQVLPNLKANLTVRNFPDSVAQIRKKLHLKEGGEDYLFATTIEQNELVIIVCKKVSNE